MTFKITLEIIQARPNKLIFLERNAQSETLNLIAHLFYKKNYIISTFLAWYSNAILNVAIEVFLIFEQSICTHYSSLSGQPDIF